MEEETIIRREVFNFPSDLVRGVPAGERRAVKLRDAKNEGDSPRRENTCTVSHVQYQEHMYSIKTAKVHLLNLNQGGT